MSNIFVGNQAMSLNTAPAFQGISKVILDVTDELYYESGDDSGRSITIFNPWGTQEQCNDLLNSLRGYEYQPMDAHGAALDPAAEIGDGVEVGDVYAMVATIERTFGPMSFANIGAPYEEEVDHEYPYIPPSERKIARQFANVKSEFRVQADQISAKVSKTGGENTSFGWVMDDISMIWYANNEQILRLDKDGAIFKGEVQALSGLIGGLDIKEGYLSTNEKTWGDEKDGFYIGPNGIQLGNGFKVDSSGNMTSDSLNLQADRITQEIKSREDDVKELNSKLVLQEQAISLEVSERENDFSLLRGLLTVESDRITAEVTAREDDISELSSRIDVNAENIKAKVSAYGNSAASFTWEMTVTGMSWYAGMTEILRLDKNGAVLEGIIRATGGDIGGLDIKEGYLSTNGKTWDDEESDGFYIGPNGIQLGTKFKVDSMGNMTADSLNLLATEITATVDEKVDGKLDATYAGDSFSWRMLPEGMVWRTTNKEIFRLDQDGAVVNGTINATSGSIGYIEIYNGYIRTSGQTWNDPQEQGFYIGPSGIKVGKKFAVDNQGNLTATSGTFTGNVKAANIKYGYWEEDGKDYGYFPGGGLDAGTTPGEKLMLNTVTSTRVSSGINTTLGYADDFNAARVGNGSAVDLFFIYDLYINNSLWIPYNNAVRKVVVQQVTIGGTNYNVLTVG